MRDRGRWLKGISMRMNKRLMVGAALTTAGLSIVGIAGVVSARGADEGRIRAVEVRETETQTWVLLRGAQSASFTAYKQGAPPRLLVDIAEADVSHLRSPVAVSNGVIGAVETEQLPGGVARVVVALTRDAGYDIKSEGEDLVIRIDGLGRTKGPGTAGRMPAGLRRLETEVRARLREEEARIVARRKELEGDLRAASKDAKGQKARSAVQAQLGALKAQLVELGARRTDEERRLVALRAAVAAEEARRREAQEAATKAQAARMRATQAQAQAERSAALREAEHLDAARAVAVADAQPPSATRRSPAG